MSLFHTCLFRKWDLLPSKHAQNCILMIHVFYPSYKGSNIIIIILKNLFLHKGLCMLCNLLQMCCVQPFSFLLLGVLCNLNACTVSHTNTQADPRLSHLPALRAQSGKYGCTCPFMPLQAFATVQWPPFEFFSNVPSVQALQSLYSYKAGIQKQLSTRDSFAFSLLLPWSVIEISMKVF